MDLENLFDSNWLIFLQTMEITNFLDKGYLASLRFQDIRAYPQNDLVTYYDENVTKDISKSIIEVILKNLLAE
jgi:hypothetical protein